MPVFRVNGKICFFAHVPKCAGSSVENYIKDRFGHIGMKDGHFNMRDQRLNWSKSSPQHIDLTSLQFILPLAMIDQAFAIVRHPVQRMVSAYRFQAGTEKARAANAPFDEWLVEQIRLSAENPFHLDNHIRPQSDFIPEGAMIFHLEHGLDAIVPYLDELAGNTDGPRVVEHTNKSHASPDRGHVADVVGQKGMALLREHYAIDFDRFGYDPEDPMPRVARPSLSSDFIVARDREIARSKRLSARFVARIKRRLRRL